MQSRAVFAVLTMRTSGGPTPFDHLVKDGHLRRLEVEPLAEESIETILHRALGGPLVAGSLRSSPRRWPWATPACSASSSTPPGTPAP